MKIFTGDRVGFLKEIEVERLKYHCLTRATGIQNEILNIRWWKKNSEDFITALTKSGTVELWDVNKRELKSLVLNIKKNPIGMEVLYSQNNKIITCSNEGIVEISNFDFDFDSELNPNLNLNDNLIDEKEIEFENKKKKIGIKKRKTRSKKLHFIENENLK
ncbi:hypothetical protein M0811_07821 [Anaeramoeba ignava]|uniref:Uncharacterized protein n=1 Tax=Anaeramoeba ignava TaxID=1746090 RepID=A0A9Q0LL32_ANAIG|nr:hypothetical protein M0811_07821 [Anaeramoeba ignava]